MINEEKAQKTNNSFTFTLLLDDVILLSDDSFADFNEDIPQPIDNHCASFKDMEIDLLTEAISTQNSSPTSPNKNLFEPRKCNLKYNPNAINENLNLKTHDRKKKMTFLSTCQVDSDNSREDSIGPIISDPFSSPERNMNIQVHRQSVFSYQPPTNKWKDTKISKIKATPFSVTKIDGSILKNSLKGKHFGRVIKKLTRFVEICKVQSYA